MDNAVITDLLVQVVGSAPATLAILYLIYRQETKEDQVITVLIELLRDCFSSKDKDQGNRSLE